MEDSLMPVRIRGSLNSSFERLTQRFTIDDLGNLEPPLLSLEFILPILPLFERKSFLKINGLGFCEEFMG